MIKLLTLAYDCNTQGYKVVRTRRLAIRAVLHGKVILDGGCIGISVVLYAAHA